MDVKQFQRYISFGINAVSFALTRNHNVPNTSSVKMKNAGTNPLSFGDNVLQNVRWMKSRREGVDVLEMMIRGHKDEYEYVLQTNASFGIPSTDTKL